MIMTCYTEIADTGLHWWWSPKHSSHPSEPLLTTGRASRERAAQTEEQVISSGQHKQTDFKSEQTVVLVWTLLGESPFLYLLGGFIRLKCNIVPI